MMLRHADHMSLFDNWLERRAASVPAVVHDIIMNKRVKIINVYRTTTIYYCLKLTSETLWRWIFLCTDAQTWSIDVFHVFCKSLTMANELWILSNDVHDRMNYTGEKYIIAFLNNNNNYENNETTRFKNCAYFFFLLLWRISRGIFLYEC